MFHCFTFFLVICFCILRLSLNTPALCPSFHGASPQSGEKPRLCLQEPAHRDHPRMGGEKSSIRVMVLLALGSPPRRRGKVRGANSGPPAPRITPAWAGKSTSRLPAWRAFGDHPRMGGEKTDDHLKGLRDLGSPPRRRGKGVRVQCSA